MVDIPRELKIYSLRDFIVRRGEIYSYFWDKFAPFFDIVIYRDYLLYNVKFSNNKSKQENIAGTLWEYLMGDINDIDLMGFFGGYRRELWEK